MDDCNNGVKSGGGGTRSGPFVGHPGAIPLPSFGRAHYEFVQPVTPPHFRCHSYSSSSSSPCLVLSPLFSLCWLLDTGHPPSQQQRLLCLPRGQSRLAGVPDRLAAPGETCSERQERQSVTGPSHSRASVPSSPRPPAASASLAAFPPSASTLVRAPSSARRPRPRTLPLAAHDAAAPHHKLSPRRHMFHFCAVHARPPRPLDTALTSRTARMNA